jgi:hypothetical protein
MERAQRTAKTLALAAKMLRVERGFYHLGKVHIPLGDGDTLALSADSAGRMRIDYCSRGRVRDTRWVIDGDERRLARVVDDLAGRVTMKG